MVLRGYGSGAVDFLFKPLNASILRSKVRVFLELRAAHRKVADAKAVLERTNLELKTAYAELQSTHAQLVQAAKMASLGELVAGIAHEINNPLAFVMSHLETVRRSLAQVEEELTAPLSETARHSWQRASDRLRETGPGLERIAELVLKLRTFSRLDEGERKCVSMRECVESVLTILGHRLREGVTVETRYGEPDEVDCFPGLLNQALLNLVANSIEAMGGRGTLRIRVGAEGEQYCVVVEDTGPGIPAHLRERVVEPFFTTKPVGEGTGLGLSITYSIAQKHGGTLELRDAVGGGSSVAIRFPLVRGEAE
jgi:two-component system NtrC family sensor kinase